MPTSSKKALISKVPAKHRARQAGVKKAVMTRSSPTSPLAHAQRPVVKTSKGFISSVGRRKSSVARVRLFAKGSGQVLINELSVDKYFSLPDYISAVFQPLQLVGLDKAVDARVKVAGGGKAGQAIAVRHGLARALLLLDENYRKQLRPAGYLTRDARVKERKKPGLKRARRAPQFSKR